MKCKACGTDITPSSRFCPGCNTDVGFPNVRMAERSEEREALAARLASAEVSSKASGCGEVLKRFGEAVVSSKVVIARSLALVHDLLKSEHFLYVSFYKQVASLQITMRTWYREHSRWMGEE